MNDEFSSAMRRAAAATRAGDVTEATNIIQDALRQGGAASVPPFKPRVRASGWPKPTGQNLRQTFTCAAGRRDYVLHLPEAGQVPKALVVMLHGCSQTPEDFAAGTGMHAHADAVGIAVLYPAQANGANAQSCWNWFAPGDQRRGAGEPAILAAMAQQIVSDHQIAQDRIFAAGLSAGGAMAVVLGQTYPEVFAAVGVHSGLPYGVAKDIPSALAAMGGTLPQVPQGRTTRTIIFQGQSDKTVHPRNAHAIAGSVPTPSDAASLTEEVAVGKRPARRTVTAQADGTPLVELWEVAGLGHAWSGGSRQGSYADPDGPDATAHMLRFFLAGDLDQ